jgi:hypothetical protein
VVGALHDAGCRLAFVWPLDQRPSGPPQWLANAAAGLTMEAPIMPAHIPAHLPEGSPIIIRRERNAHRRGA